MTNELPEPTERELQILKVLWQAGEASVYDVYLALRDELGIVQNTVQAFLRTMEQKGLVRHRTEGRTFVYRAVKPREQTEKHIVGGVLDRLFDGAVDALVAQALTVKRPSEDEIERLRAMLDDFERKRGASKGRKP